MAVADILLTPAAIWYAPVGETVPDENEVGYGEEWGGNWTNLGYTLTPLTMAVTRDTYRVIPEQLTSPVKLKYVSEEIVFETTLAEFTEETLEVAFGGVVTDTPASAGQVGVLEMDVGGDPTPDVYTFGFEGEYVDDSNNSFPVRIFVWKGVAVLGGNLTFAKNEAAGIPIRIEAFADTSRAVGEQTIRIQKVYEAAGS